MIDASGSGIITHERNVIREKRVWIETNFQVTCVETFENLVNYTEKGVFQKWSIPFLLHCGIRAD